MRKLKDQIESARQEYLTTKYPGDLASEILFKAMQQPAHVHRSRWMRNVGALAAAAAMIIVALLLRTPADLTTPNVEIAMEIPTELAQVALSDLPSMSMPAPPSDWDTRGSDAMDLSPDAPDFSFTAPSFSFSEDSQQSSTFATQEVIL